MLKMNENLRWLAINAPDWNNNLDRIARGSVGVDWFSSENFPGRIGFSREELRVAKAELSDERMDAMNNISGYWQHMTDDITAYDPPGPTTMPECTFTTPDEDEAWAEAEKRMHAIGHNGGTGEHYPAPEYDPQDVVFPQPGYHGRPASKYHVQIKGQWVDVYDILSAYGVTNPADAHAIKKMLCPGQRGVKGGIQDRQEAIVSLQRAIELEQGR